MPLKKIQLKLTFFVVMTILIKYIKCNKETCCYDVSRGLPNEVINKECVLIHDVQNKFVLVSLSRYATLNVIFSFHAEDPSWLAPILVYLIISTEEAATIKATYPYIFGLVQSSNNLKFEL